MSILFEEDSARVAGRALIETQIGIALQAEGLYNAGTNCQNSL
jgi:hypothetical protein